MLSCLGSARHPGHAAAHERTVGRGRLDGRDTRGIVAAGTPSTIPGGSAETPAPTPGSSGTPGTPSPTSTPSPTGTSIVRAYFFLGSFTGNAGLVPVLREVPRTQAVAAAAMNALLAGPNDTELAARPAMYTVVPAGTRLLGLSITDGVATVDLSREYESGGGSASMFARLAQVVYTLTQFPTVNGVLFQLDGQPVTIFGGEGLILDHAVGRADYQDQLPAVFVDRPAWGAALGNPGTVSGLANTFEAMFQVQLLDAAGTLLVNEHHMASCGTGLLGHVQHPAVLHRGKRPVGHPPGVRVLGQGRLRGARDRVPGLADAVRLTAVGRRRGASAQRPHERPTRCRALVRLPRRSPGRLSGCSAPC